MRKKIIPITLSVAMMINTAVLPASAAQKPVANPGFSVISSTTQKDGEVVFYSFNVPSNSMAKVTIEYTSARRPETAGQRISVRFLKPRSDFASCAQTSLHGQARIPGRRRVLRFPPPMPADRADRAA